MDSPSSEETETKVQGWWQWARSTAMGLLQPDIAATSPRTVCATTLSEEQTRLVVTVQAAARASVISSASLDEFKETLSGCSWVSQVINLRDSSGYNLLQTAIIMNRADIVEHLIGQGADLNSPICGRPLHLAAQLGLVGVLEVLFRLGADPRVQSAVCYPSPHSSTSLLYNPSTREWVSTCQKDVLVSQKAELLASSSSRKTEVPDRKHKETMSHHQLRGCFNYPLHFAIKGDNVDCVKLLEQHGAAHLNDGELPLHTAVLFGSKACIEYFLRSQEETMNVADVYGRVPLHYSVTMGKGAVQLLVQKGASLSVKTQQQQTLLHLLFTEIGSICGMADLCAYLLDCGLKMTINALDEDGNSALHVCLMRVHQAMPTTETEWQELERCVRLLLEQKANPNITNRKGNMPLHVLLDIFHFDENGRQNLTQGFDLKADAVERLLSLLLSHNANPRIPSKWSGSRSGHVPLDTPLMVFIYHLFLKGYAGWIYHAAKMLKPEEQLTFLRRFRRMSCSIIEQLTKPAGAIRHDGGYHGKQRLPSCPVRLLLNHLEYIKVYGQEGLTEQLPILHDYLSAMLEYLRMLLRVGFCPDACKDPAQIVDTFSMLYEHKLVPFTTVCDFLLVLLQHGADANSCRYIIYDGVAAPDLDSFPLVRLLRPDTDPVYTREEKQTLIDILMTSMDRHSLNQCLQHYSRQQNQDGAAIDVCVQQRFSTPPRLKALTAQVIRCSLKKKLLPKITGLPLPTKIKEYLLQLQY